MGRLKAIQNCETDPPKAASRSVPLLLGQRDGDVAFGGDLIRQTGRLEIQEALVHQPAAAALWLFLIVITAQDDPRPVLSFQRALVQLPLMHGLQLEAAF